MTERLDFLAERERLRTQTERDRLERQLHQSQRLESLGQLAGGVAHDFNNLLGVISNYVDFVDDEVARQLPGGRGQAIRDDIEQVRQAAGRAAGLTHQLLAFARQEVIKPQALNLNGVVESVEQLLIRTLGEHIELITDLAVDLSPVLADSGQIEQVLVNLAVNARDAMPGGGKLTIQTSNTEIDGTMGDRAELPPGRYAALKVIDTGAGMPKEVLDRVFEPFFTTKPKGQGTGLGLATVYGIIKQAGGRLRIYSEPGMGTVLTVLLPVTEHEPAPAVRPAPQAQQGQGEIILVVEDEPADARGLPADSDTQRLPRHRRGRRPRGARHPRRPGGSHRRAAHRRHHAPNARTGTRRQGPHPPTRRTGRVHVRLHPGPAKPARRA